MLKQVTVLILATAFVSGCATKTSVKESKNIENIYSFVDQTIGGALGTGQMDKATYYAEEGSGDQMEKNYHNFKTFCQANKGEFSYSPSNSGKRDLYEEYLSFLKNEGKGGFKGVMNTLNTDKNGNPAINEAKNAWGNLDHPKSREIIKQDLNRKELGVYSCQDSEMGSWSVKIVPIGVGITRNTSGEPYKYHIRRIIKIDNQAA